jgi:hypothetical protein
VSADAPGTPHGSDEPSEVTSLLGDSPLVQRSVGEPDDVPGEPGTAPPVPEPTLPVASSSPAPIPGDQPPIVLRSATAETAGATPARATGPSPTIQRATTLPLAAPTPTAPTSAQAQAPPAQAHAAPEPAPALVVARLIGDRSLPLRAAPEPDQGATTPPHPAATVQRWPDPYGIATPQVQRTAALPSSRNALAGDVAGAPTAAAMAPGWIVPPGTESVTDLTPQLVAAPIPGLPLQRAHAAPGAPQPGWSPGTPVGPVAAPAVQRVVETQAAPVQIDFTSGVPVVSREAETPVPDAPAPAPEPPAAAPAGAPSVPTSGQATAAPAAPAAGGGTPEELLAKIFDPLLRRLKTELRLDRERHGSLTDLRH